MLLEIKNLKTSFFTDEGVAKSVDDVSFAIPRGETVGVVGESGCGKSVSAMSIMGLVAPPGRVVGGEILFHHAKSDKSDSAKCVDLLTLSEAEMRKYRGKHIAMIFQEPMSSLNPVFRVGNQISEAVLLHNPGISKEDAWNRAVEMLRQVRIPEAEQRAREFPHQFSGGMRQRVMIAMALSCNPELLIADEPTTALDVTIQAQILDLLRNLQQSLGMSIMFITHDLGVIAEIASRVVVMYASKVVETADVKTIFKNPRHPYTLGLLKSRPELGNILEENEEKKTLFSIPGAVPSPLQFPSGCKFHPRCPMCEKICRQREPELVEIDPGHLVRCHFARQSNHSSKAQKKQKK
ncbi:MAG: ABC transporter ATP-binding protein [Planctomycetia bacterium]|nr:ABC transporter ATP-binding protein [Planctomycetia bacterium]